MVGLDTNCWNA